MDQFGIDVRRLAAIDMHGLKGSRFRARVILAEFILGAVIGPLLGLLIIVAGSGVGARLFGLWVLGAGLNYVPLALHAVSLSRPGALRAELDGADVPSELRYYTVAQLWVFVPLSLMLFALVQARSGESA